MSVNHLNQVKSREEFKKKINEANEEGNSPQNASKVQSANDNRIRIRIIPIWLRIVLLVIFTGVFMVAGAAVGYGVLGNGNAGDVLKGSTWSHIIDLVEKK